MRKQPSEGMKKMYADKRKNTTEKIQNAIDLIQDEGRIVTKKELMQLTGISSGTFSQDYVKEILKINKVCQYKETSKITSNKEEKLATVKDRSIESLQKKIASYESKMQNKDILISKQEKEIEKLQNALKDKTNSYELLVGKFQQLMEAYDAIGGNINYFLKN